MNIVPTPITAALAGAFTGIVMPFLWARFFNDTLVLTAAFLLVVALPAHALVVGMGRHQAPGGRAVDVPLLKRAGAWLVAVVICALLLPIDAMLQKL